MPLSKESFKRIATYVPWPLLVGAGVLAWALGYAQEDAYISFRYAENLLQGHGLTFNPGEAPVEGYSNFLWVLWAAFFGVFTDDFPRWVQFSGVLFWIANLWLVYKIIKRNDGLSGGVLGMLVIGFNAVIASSVATGLETPLAAFWVTLGLYFWMQEFHGGKPQPLRPFHWSMVGVLAALTRPDLALPFLIMGIFWLGDWIGKRELRKVIYWAPALLLSIAYLCWKWSYFGELLPNTFYAKLGGSVMDGGRLVALFLISTGIGAFLFAVPAKLSRLQVVLVATLCFWVLFGGDYMGFRVLVPLSSLGMLLTYGVIKPIHHPPKSTLKSKILIAWLIVGIVLSYFWPAWIQNSQRIQFAAEMKRDAEGPEGLMEYGNALVKAFGQDTSIRMATGAAGIVPYLTRYHTLDMMGLTNREVAKNYKKASNLAGHGRFANAGWVKKNGANIVVGRWIEPKESLQNLVVADTLQALQLTLPSYQSARDSNFIPKILWLDLPKSQFGLAIIYLKPHPAIDNALNSPSKRGILAVSPILPP